MDELGGLAKAAPLEEQWWKRVAAQTGEEEHSSAGLPGGPAKAGAHAEGISAKPGE